MPSIEFILTAIAGVLVGFVIGIFTYWWLIREGKLSKKTKPRNTRKTENKNLYKTFIRGGLIYYFTIRGEK